MNRDQIIDYWRRCAKNLAYWQAGDDEHSQKMRAMAKDSFKKINAEARLAKIKRCDLLEPLEVKCTKDS